MKRILLIGVLLVVAIGLYLRLGNDRTVGAVDEKAAREEEIAVKTVAAKVQPMPVVAEAVGTVEPEHRVEVRPEMNGVLEEVLFREGEDVRKGQRLFRIDDRAARATLDQAQATLARDEAQLLEARAQRERLKPLAEREYITRQEYEQALASMEALAATAKADRAQVEMARVQLGYSEIRAPITGRTGSLAVKEGNLVNTAGATPLVVIMGIDPVQVAFNIPQRYLEEVRRQAGSGDMRVAIYREQGRVSVAEGKVVFIDNTVNPQTGTVLLKARVPNRDQALWPGEFILAQLVLKIEPDAVVVPASAVRPGQKGPYVYIVDDAKARLRPVQVLRQVEDLAVIGEGLKGGELVITELPFNLTPGKAVKPTGEPHS